MRKRIPKSWCVVCNNKGVDLTPGGINYLCGKHKDVPPYEWPNAHSRKLP